MSFVPNFEERMQEEMTAFAEKERQEEPYEVKSAREAHERAQERLARVNEPGRGFRNYSHDDREAARRDAAEKERTYLKVSNEHTREKYLAELEEKKAAKAKENATLAEKTRQEAETQLRATYLTRWKSAGGDEKGFEATWPSIRDEHYKRAMFEKGNALENSLRAGSMGVF